MHENSYTFFDQDWARTEGISKWLSKCSEDIDAEVPHKHTSDMPKNGTSPYLEGSSLPLVWQSKISQVSEFWELHLQLLPPHVDIISAQARDFPSISLSETHTSMDWKGTIFSLMCYRVNITLNYDRFVMIDLNLYSMGSCFKCLTSSEPPKSHPQNKPLNVRMLHHE